MSLRTTAVLSASLAAFAAPVATAQFAGIALTSGVDGFVALPYDPSMIPTSGITVEAWIQYDGTTLPAGWQFPTICRQALSAGDESYFLRVQAETTQRNVIRWAVATQGGTINVDWTFTAGQLTTWTHLAATYDGSTSRIIVDGVEVASTTGVGGPIVDNFDPTRPTDFEFNIGRGSPVGGIEVFNGSIDEFRFWPYARTAAEIAQTKDEALLAVPAGVSTWNFDNDYLDSSGGRNGTPNGTINFVAPAISTLNILGGISFGASTAGCTGAITQAMSSQFVAGNSAFALVAFGIPSTAPTVAQISFLGGLPAPINILGFDLWINVGATASVAATPAGLGVMRAPLGLSAGTQTGLTIATQFLSIDACGPQGITASNALTLTTL